MGGRERWQWEGDRGRGEWEGGDEGRRKLMKIRKRTIKWKIHGITSIHISAPV